MTTIVADEAALRRVVAEEVERVLKPVVAALVGLRGTQGVSSDDALLTGAQVAEQLQVDRRTLRRLVLEGAVPAPMLIGDRTRRWCRETFEKWLQAKVAK